MDGKLVLDRMEANADGVRIFVFEYATDEKTQFFAFAETQMPPELVRNLRQGHIIRAAWTEQTITSGEILEEETKRAEEDAADLLARLFAKGKKKK